MEQIPEKESIFISGIDSTITEADLKEFFTSIIKSDCNIIIHHFSVLNRPRAIGEAILTVDDSILAHQQLNNAKLKNCYIKLLPKSTMKSLILTNLPNIVSEKDLFLLLNKITAGLKRITIADDPEISGKTANLALISYQSYEQTKSALETLKVQNKILGKTVSAVWKDPHYDILSELALETRVIYIKNMSASTDTEKLREIVSPFGNIVKLKKFVGKAFVEFESIASAKKAIEQCNEKRFDGLVWKVFPSKIFDEQKVKENPDKNMLFSKNFLEEDDQQVLLKFAFDGTLADISPQVIQTANNILEAAKKFQVTTVNELKQRYNDMVAAKNTITVPSVASTPSQSQASGTKNDSAPPKKQQDNSFHHGKPSRTQEKLIKRQNFKQQRHTAGMIGQRYPQDNVFQHPPGTNPPIDRPPMEMNPVVHPPGMNQYEVYPRPVIGGMPVEYPGNAYYAPLGQNPYVVGGHWNTMVPQQVPQQLVPGNNFMGQPQFLGVNPVNPNNVNPMYLNPGVPQNMGGNPMGKGYGVGFQGRY